MAVKTITPKDWPIIASADGRFWSEYPNGDKPTGVPGQAILNWTNPGGSPDGSAVYHGTAPGVYSSRTVVAAGLSTLTITGLPAGLRYFAVNSIWGLDSNGQALDESVASNEVSLVIT